MSRIIIIILITLIASCGTVKNKPFDSAVRSLFFGVNIADTTGSLISSFDRVSKLKYKEPSTQQWNLNVTIEMGSDDDVLSSQHIFTFTESPVEGLKIKSGKISLTLGETKTRKKIVGKYWVTQFDTKSGADSFFTHIKKLFTPLSTHKNVYLDPDGYEIAEFSTRNPAEKGIRDISFTLGKIGKSEYQISLKLWNELETK